MMSPLSAPLLWPLDPDSTGHVSHHRLGEYWAELGVDVEDVLEDLNIDAKELLNVREVEQMLCQHLEMVIESLRYPAMQAAIYSLVECAGISTTTLSTVTKERNDLREDIKETQRKAAQFSMEIDDMKYQHEAEKKKELQAFEEKFAHDLKTQEQERISQNSIREAETEAIKRMFEAQQLRLENVQLDLKREISRLSKINRDLEEENENINLKLQESIEKNKVLNIEIDNAKALTNRLLSIENCNSGSFESLDLIKSVEELMKVNKELKDRNEELEINMLSIPFHDNSSSIPTNGHPQTNEHEPSDSLSSARSCKISQKQSTCLSDSLPCDFRSLDNDCESDGGDDEFSFSDVWCNFDGETKISPSCPTLEDELDHVKSEIMKMMSEKEQGTKGDQKLEKYQHKITELEEENQRLKHLVKELDLETKTKAVEQDKSDKTVNIPDILIANNGCSAAISADRSSPDGQEMDDKCPVQRCQVDTDDIMRGEDSHAKLLDEKNMQMEISQLLAENKHLEDCLAEIQTEFESMENYWQKKLDDERLFYDEELKLCQAQVKELELKISEYDEILENSLKDKIDGKHELYDIDEQRYLEEKVNEWEDEISLLKLHIVDLESAHEDEIVSLKEAFEKEMDAFKQHKNAMANQNIKSPICSKCSTLSEKRRRMEQSWVQVVESGTCKTSEIVSDTPSEHLSSKDDLSHKQKSDIFANERSAYDCDKVSASISTLHCGISEQEGFPHGNQAMLKNSQVSSGKGSSEMLDNEKVMGKGEEYILSEAITKKSHFDFQADCEIEECDNMGGSVTSAYQAILTDIKNQVKELQGQLSSVETDNKVELAWLQGRVDMQSDRCRQLNTCLALQKGRNSQQSKAAREQHRVEVEQLETLVATSQDLLRKQVRNYMETMVRIEQNEAAIEKLLGENKRAEGSILGLKKNYGGRENKGTRTRT